MNGFFVVPVPIIAKIFFCTKFKDTGTFSNVRDIAPTLYTSCNTSSSFNEKCSSGALICPLNSVEPTPNRKSKKSS